MKLLRRDSFAAVGYVGVVIEKSWKPEWVVRADSRAGEFIAEIGRAKRRDDMPDVWFCPVSMPSIFEKEKPIAGVDAEQAFELALQFAKTVFENNGADVDSFEITRVENDDPEV